MAYADIEMTEEQVQQENELFELLRRTVEVEDDEEFDDLGHIEDRDFAEYDDGSWD